MSHHNGFPFLLYIKNTLPIHIRPKNPKHLSTNPDMCARTHCRQIPNTKAQNLFAQFCTKTHNPKRYSRNNPLGAKIIAQIFTTTIPYRQSYTFTNISHKLPYRFTLFAPMHIFAIFYVTIRGTIRTTVKRRQCGLRHWVGVQRQKEASRPLQREREKKKKKEKKEAKKRKKKKKSPKRK